MNGTREGRSLVDALANKRIGRRDFIIRALALGLSMPAIGTILAACAQPTATPAPTAAPAATAAPAGKALLPEIKKRGVVKVCNAVAPPWVMKKEDGTLFGMEIETANAVADRIGVKAEFVESTWANLIPSLQAGLCDVIITGSSQTEKRKEAVDFSHKYDPQGQVFIYRADSTKIKTLEDINDPKTVVVFIGGTAVEPFMDKMFPKATRKRLSGGAEATLIYEEIRGGQSDTSPIPGSMVPVLKKQLPWSAFLPVDPKDALDPVYAGMAVRKGEGADLLEVINGWLDEVGKTDYWDKQRAKWFTYEFLGGG